MPVVFLFNQKQRDQLGVFGIKLVIRPVPTSVAKTYPDNWNMYVQVLSQAKIDKVYNNIIYKDFLKKTTNTALKSYNEFDI